MHGWHHDGHGWRHRPWWKVAINTVLRAFQPQARKLVVVTHCREADPPEVLGYGVRLVLHLPRTPEGAPDPRSNARE